MLSLRFRPYHEEVADLARVHGTNERVAVSDLGPAVSFYMRLVPRFEIKSDFNKRGISLLVEAQR